MGRRVLPLTPECELSKADSKFASVSPTSLIGGYYLLGVIIWYPGVFAAGHGSGRYTAAKRHLGTSCHHGPAEATAMVDAEVGQCCGTPMTIHSSACVELQ